jgi:RING finger/CHY zinc finger protein 1
LERRAFQAENEDVPLSDGAHEVPRFEITEVVCAACSFRQPRSGKCSSCGVQFAVYFCEKCNLWDDNAKPKKIFHCDECGICRVGGRENFFHCSTCGSCYANSLRDSHKCIENSMHSNCPMCQENMFHSTRTVQILRCGHTIHSECLHTYMRGASTTVAVRENYTRNECSFRLFDVLYATSQ